jgi:arylsulfatase A-like enzyme
MPKPPPILPACVLVLFASAAVAQLSDRGGSPGGPVTRELQPRIDTNILIIVADDLGVDSLSVYGEGNDIPPTPNLDTLAAGGVLFRNAWAQPTCSPTRATLQTGLHGFRNGIGTSIASSQDTVGLSFDLMSLPKMLDLGTGLGYAHAAIGKWHLSGQNTDQLAPNLTGYEHFAGTLEGQLGDYFSFDKVVNGVTVPVSNYATSEVVDDTLEWIEQQTKPWMCYVSFQAPHAPFHAPPASLHSQTLADGDPRASCSDTSGLDPRPFFKALVEAMDTEIGRLLTGIPPFDLRKTTVIFLGDNGTDFCLGVSPFDGPAKSTLYEGGINVPLIVWGANVPRPGESQALVQTTDLLATVADLARIDLAELLPGENFDSVSMLPYFSQPHLRSIRESVFVEIFNPNGATDFNIPPCPPSFCQEDTGYGTPAGPVLSSCGPPLFGIYVANLAPLQVTGAPPNALATLRIGSLNPAFDPILGAEVISLFPAALLNFVTDASGNLNASVFTGGISQEPYYQFVFEDPMQPTGFVVSNSVRMEFLDTRMFAIRDERYKLIHFSSCHQELYDLQNDGFEQNDLSSAGLTPDAAGRAYDLYRTAVGLR